MAKYRIRKTGEIVYVVSYVGSCTARNKFFEDSDRVSYIDSNGVEHPDEKMNLYWDLEPVDDEIENKKEIDWEERRYELAKAAMQGYCANPAYDDTFEKHAELSVEMADALIKKLKGE